MHRLYSNAIWNGLRGVPIASIRRTLKKSVQFMIWSHMCHLTQVSTQNRKRVDGISGDSSAGKYFFLEQIPPKSAEKLRSAPLAAAHNPKVVGSNPAPATKKTLKSQDFRAFSLLLLKNNLGQKMGQRFDPCADPYGETIL